MPYDTRVLCVSAVMVSSMPHNRADLASLAKTRAFIVRQYCFHFMHNHVLYSFMRRAVCAYGTHALSDAQKGHRGGWWAYV